jgi:hypothetical protein
MLRGERPRCEECRVAPDDARRETRKRENPCGTAWRSCPPIDQQPPRQRFRGARGDALSAGAFRRQCVDCLGSVQQANPRSPEWMSRAGRNGARRGIVGMRPSDVARICLDFTTCFRLWLAASSKYPQSGFGKRRIFGARILSSRGLGGTAPKRATGLFSKEKRVLKTFDKGCLSILPSPARLTSLCVSRGSSPA